MKLSTFKTLAITTVLATLSSQSFAALSGTLLLKGNVPAVLAISVDAEAIASSLPLDTTQTDTLVAVVNEKSNSTSGYKVSISSDNAGKLVHESESASTITYSLSYDGQSVDLANGDEFTYGSAPVDVDRDVTISYTGKEHTELFEGDYSDTVTFSIAAN